MKKFALLAPLAASFGAAHAALPEGVTTAITTAQTDMVALFAALTATGVVIWVARVIYNKFKVR